MCVCVCVCVCVLRVCVCVCVCVTSYLHQNWEAMTTLLLDSSCGVELSAQEEKALVEVLACAVRRAGGSAPSALKGRGKVSS